jgi:hypothetical protein
MSPVFLGRIHKIFLIQDTDVLITLVIQFGLYSGS